MVVIRARSSREVQQLRGMDLGIAKVRSDASRPPSDKSLSGGYIVEVVVTPGQLSRLEALGFDVSEVPRWRGAVACVPNAASSIPADLDALGASARGAPGLCATAKGGRPASLYPVPGVPGELRRPDEPGRSRSGVLKKSNGKFKVQII
jgi:hypothetical protein